MAHLYTPGTHRTVIAESIPAAMAHSILAERSVRKGELLIAERNGDGTRTVVVASRGPRCATCDQVVVVE
jgi:hypothetical protein